MVHTPISTEPVIVEHSECYSHSPQHGMTEEPDGDLASKTHLDRHEQYDQRDFEAPNSCNNDVTRDLLAEAPVVVEEEQPSVQMASRDESSYTQPAQVVHAPSQLSQAQVRARRARMSVPSIPDVLTVLGHAMCAQFEESDRVREARHSELSRTKEVIRTLEARCANLEHEKQISELQVSDTAKRLMSCQEKLEKAKKFSKGLSNDVDREKGRNKNLEDEISQLKLDVRKLTEDLDTARKEVEKAQQELIECKSRLAKESKASEESSMTLKQENTDLVSKIKVLERDVRHLESDRDRFKSEVEKHEVKSTQLSSVLQGHHDSLLDRLSELSNAADSHQDSVTSQQISHIRDTLQSLTTATPATTEEVNQSVARLEAK